MRYVGAAIGAAGALGVGGAAEAQDWSVTPRYWYYFDNINQRESAIDPAYGLDGGLATLEGVYEDLIGEDVSVSPLFTNAAGASDQMSIPLTGGTVAFDLGDSGAQVSLTALYGETESTADIVSTTGIAVDIAGYTAHDTFIQTSHATTETKRADVEIAVQHRINETFMLLYGVRYEHTEDSAVATQSVASTNNAANLVSDLYYFGITEYELTIAGATASSEFANDRIGVRLGGAAFAPIGDKHVFYVNGMIHATQQIGGEATTRVDYDDAFIDDVEVTRDYASETSIGPDISVGYLHRFNDRIGLDLRYRGIMYFPVAGESNFEDPRVNHGLNIGLSIWFGA